MPSPPSSRTTQPPSAAGEAATPPSPDCRRIPGRIQFTLAPRDSRWTNEHRAHLVLRQYSESGVEWHWQQTERDVGAQKDENREIAKPTCGPLFTFHFSFGTVHFLRTALEHSPSNIRHGSCTIVVVPPLHGASISRRPGQPNPPASSRQLQPNRSTVTRFRVSGFGFRKYHV